MNKFKIGDKVIYKNRIDLGFPNILINNMVGIVKCVCLDEPYKYYYAVDFENFDKGHACGGYCGEKSGYYIEEPYLELLENTILKLDDIIIVNYEDSSERYFDTLGIIIGFKNDYIKNKRFVKFNTLSSLDPLIIQDMVYIIEEEFVKKYTDIDNVKNKILESEIINKNGRVYSKDIFKELVTDKIKEEEGFIYSPYIPLQISKISEQIKLKPRKLQVQKEPSKEFKNIFLIKREKFFFNDEE